MKKTDARILAWLEKVCPDHLWEPIGGDLVEQFHLNSERRGSSYARWKLLKSVVGFLRPAVLFRKDKYHRSTSFNSVPMLYNYLKISFRNLRKQGLFTAINVFGLAVGLTASILIILWVSDELAFDRFHQDSDRIFQVMENRYGSEGTIHTAENTRTPLLPLLDANFSHHSGITRVWPGRLLLQSGDKGFYEAGIYADADFFKVFSFEEVAGVAASAFTLNNSIVITEEVAKKHFGNESALGKSISTDSGDEFIVAAVLSNIPEQSSLKFKFVIPFDYYFQRNKSWMGQWNNLNVKIFLKLNGGIDKKDAILAFDELSPIEPLGDNASFFLRPFTDRHLYNRYNNGVQDGGRIEYLQLFSFIAFLVLLIAAINFANLSTTQSIKRLKEIGVRKVLGARRKSIGIQFAADSMVLAFAALIFALVMTALLLPAFGTITGKSILISDLGVQSVLWIMLTTIFAGALGGLYPSVYAARQSPLSSLRNNENATGGGRLRKILVSLQYISSTALIIGSLVIYSQMEYLLNEDIGLSKDRVIVMPLRGEARVRTEFIRTQLEANPSIDAVSFSFTSPVDFGTATSSVEWDNKDPEETASFSYFSVDYNFEKVLGLKFKEGRSFETERSDDTNIVINEAAAQLMFPGQSAIGKEVVIWGRRRGVVIGVVHNFNFRSMRSQIPPLIIMLKAERINNLIASIKPSSGWEPIVEELSEIHSELGSFYPFEYSFLGQEWEKLYSSEQRLSKLFNYFSSLAILIATLGLFALSAHSAQQRLKELSIRRVLGAKVGQLVLMFNADFLRVLLFSSIVGAILAGYFLNQWLSGFAYNMELTAIHFVIPPLTVLLLASVVISFHALMASLKNPASILKED